MNGAVERASDVLLAFLDGDGDSVGISELARRLGLSKTVVHRIVRTLVSREFVAPVPGGRYRLGAASAALGARALRDNALRSLALPHLRRLQQTSRETATVSSLVGFGRAYLDQILGPQELTMTVELGRIFPLTVGAASRAILAFASPDVMDEVLARPFENPAFAEAGALRNGLALTRSDRVAVSRNERRSGAAAIAAPVLGIDGYAIGSVSICGPVGRFDAALTERCSPFVRDAGEQIARELGWDGRINSYI